MKVIQSLAEFEAYKKEVEFDAANVSCCASLLIVGWADEFIGKFYPKAKLVYETRLDNSNLKEVRPVGMIYSSLYINNGKAVLETRSIVNIYTVYEVPFDGYTVTICPTMRIGYPQEFVLIADTRNYKDYGFAFEEKKPQKTAKPTDNKMRDWATYLFNRSVVYDTYVKERNNKFEDFISELRKSGFTPVMRGEHKGYVEKNGLRLAFSEMYGHIYTTISVSTSVEQNVNNFIKISKGEYE